MSDHPVDQWEYGREVTKDDLRPGDLVYFKEAGEDYPITHVGIYSGRDNIIHASSYWGQVVERPMEHVSGYFGARRLETE
jgi:cell wall-associated NlpC family hydrolase